jgi:hypothetical protein
MVTVAVFPRRLANGADAREKRVRRGKAKSWVRQRSRVLSVQYSSVSHSIAKFENCLLVHCFFVPFGAHMCSLSALFCCFFANFFAFDLRLLDEQYRHSYCPSTLGGVYFW